MADFFFFALTFAIGALVLFLLLRCRSSTPKDFPPGPWGVPLLGALPFLGKRPYKTLADWRPRFGPIVGLNFAGRRCVVLSELEVIKEAGNNPAFAGRPELPFATERSGGVAEGIIFTSGRKWQEQRRFTLRRLRDFGFGTRSMEAIVQEEVQELVERFRKNEGRPVSTAHAFNAAIVNALWTIVAGERFQQEDPKLLRIFEMFKDFAQPSLRAMLAGLIPGVRKYVPDSVTGWSSVIRALKSIEDFIRPYLDAHLATHVPDQPRDFIDTYIDEMKSTTDPESSFHSSHPHSLLFTIFDLFMAGAETTSTTMTWILLYLARNPHAQEAMQAEIDRVVGSRLPSLADRAEMPYTEAVIHEVLRSRPLSPLTTQCTTEDVDFHGYAIPKDTMVMFNVYAVVGDPRLWGDPENFRPERFLSKAGEFERREGFIPFSVGKRACLGERLARDELFLFTTAIFQAFKVDWDRNEGTAPPTLENAAVGIALPIPQPHKLAMTPR